MIYLKYPNLLYFLFYGSATELHQVDPNTMKHAITNHIAFFQGLMHENN